MRDLVVVDNPKRWPEVVAGVEVVAARDYLVDPARARGRNVRIHNLCRSYRPQTTGYYVSLLAEARGHRPLPSVLTQQELGSSATLRFVGDELRELIERELADVPGEDLAVDIFWGATERPELRRLGRAIFGHYPAPLLRAELVRGTRWRLDGVRLLAIQEVTEEHRPFLVEQARRHFARAARRNGPEQKEFRFDLAILVDPQEVDAPSDATAIQRFVRAAERLGMSATLLQRDELGRVGEFDALFLRATTAVDHHTFRFASRAAAEGLVVIDDPVSILRCTNKVFLAEAFARANVPCPRTVIVHRDNAADARGLGFPVVLKAPDSSFSRGVHRADDEAALERMLELMWRDSELVVAQAWTPSEFDWRVGVLGGRPLFLARYHMARGHWQIQKNLEGTRRRYGRVDSLPLQEAPPGLLDVAARAAATVGTGLYGVDVKQVGPRFLVMEVNDNPNIDAGGEDRFLGDALYEAIMRHFLDALEARVATQST